MHSCLFEFFTWSSRLFYSPIDQHVVNDLIQKSLPISVNNLCRFFNHVFISYSTCRLKLDLNNVYILTYIFSILSVHKCYFSIFRDHYFWRVLCNPFIILLTISYAEYYKRNLNPNMSVYIQNIENMNRNHTLIITHRIWV